MCIDIGEIWFGIANGQISSILTKLSVFDTSVFLFRDDNLSDDLNQWIFTNLGVCVDTMEISFWIANGQFS